MLDESDEEGWAYRRQPAIRRHWNAAIRRGADDIDYLAPEIQLLNALPHLTADARHWLLQGLRQTAPAHAWIERLERRE